MSYVQPVPNCACPTCNLFEELHAKVYWKFGEKMRLEIDGILFLPHNWNGKPDLIGFFFVFYQVLQSIYGRRVDTR
jgi:hypothetical protein